MKTLLLAAVAALLTGCAAKVLSTSPRSVLVHAAQAAEAQTAADQECAKHQRKARLVSLPRNAHYLFDCVD